MRAIRITAESVLIGIIMSLSRVLSIHGTIAVVTMIAGDNNIALNTEALND
jgi:hypothetical protein